MIRTYWKGKMGRKGNGQLFVFFINFAEKDICSIHSGRFRVPYSFFLMAGVLAAFAIPGILLAR